MATKAKAKKEPVKKPVLSRAKDSAREQIDQFLLGLQHSSLVKFSSKLKAADSSDLFMMVGRKVLEQAEAIRATLPETGSQVLKPFKAAARVAYPLKKSTAKPVPGSTRKRTKKAKKK